MNYGFLSGRPMPKHARIPHADEAHYIARAQSILTRNGRVGPVLPYEQARKIVHRHQLQDLTPEELIAWEENCGLTASGP